MKPFLFALYLDNIFVFHWPFQIKPAVNQIECHPYLTQDPLVAFCKAQDIHITAYSPLGCKDRVWRSDNDDVPLLEHPILLQVAKKYEKTVPQLLLKWQVCYINHNQCCQLL